MIKKTFEKVNEDLYYEKLSNGIDVYMYSTKKTKNFYMSISVKYGARIEKYKVNSKVFDVIPGSAHFLEHKVMALSENEEISKRINELGSLANAWTSYYGTNYNLFGSINIRENLNLLLDIFYNTNITEKNVSEEKGIIGEEIDMYKDQIDDSLYSKLFKNLFHDSYIKNTVVAERNDISKITAKSLNKIYSDYYLPNNTFIIITGDFDPNIIINDIKNYMSKINLKPKTLPKRIKNKDKYTTNVSYEEVKKDINNCRVKYALKIDKSKLNMDSDFMIRSYLNIILSNNFSPSSSLYEKYKNEGIIINMNSSVNIIDDYVVIVISALCNDGCKFIKNIEKDIKNISIKKDDFERKKKLFLKSFILDFDNIEDIEFNICTQILTQDKIDYDEYSKINNMDYNIACKLIKLLDFNNFSIIKTIK